MPIVSHEFGNLCIKIVSQKYENKYKKRAIDGRRFSMNSSPFFPTFSPGPSPSLVTISSQFLFGAPFSVQTRGGEAEKKNESRRVFNAHPLFPFTRAHGGQARDRLRPIQTAHLGRKLSHQLARRWHLEQNCSNIRLVQIVL